MRKILLGFAMLISSAAEAAPETPYGFVSFYLHEIASIDSYRLQAARNQSASPRDMGACVHDMEAWRLELIGAANSLNEMELPRDNPAHEAPQLIAQTLEGKARSVAQLGEICAKFIGEPQEGVDYNALAAAAPKTAAQLEAADKASFAGAGLAFASLISMKPDSAGHVSFLTISAEQREMLLRDIKSDFGSEAHQTDQGYAAETAKLFSTKLREYHVSDEREKR